MNLYKKTYEETRLKISKTKKEKRESIQENL